MEKDALMNVLDHIMDTQEAAQLWGLTPDYVKALCVKEEVVARKIGRVWILAKDQPNPRKRNSKNR